MVVKVIFVGSPLGGDDGIGPYLYEELKSNPSLEGFELLELGVIGLDMISYVNDGDNLIIIDAIYSDESIGDVVLVDEKGFEKGLKVASLHDFGVEQTVQILKNHVKLKKISLIGVKVKNVNACTLGLSEEIMQMKETIINNVLNLIKKCV
ncbi:hypothetical protein C0585_08520 [Candidatus Woesearchaeota archaeon]|nr:MAG: hypothetical protein C0585_08520 [Candidatus Woesearchaeota archaeon]